MEKKLLIKAGICVQLQPNDNYYKVNEKEEAEIRSDWDYTCCIKLDMVLVKHNFVNICEYINESLDQEG